MEKIKREAEIKNGHVRVTFTFADTHDRIWLLTENSQLIMEIPCKTIRHWTNQVIDRLERVILGECPKEWKTSFGTVIIPCEQGKDAIKKISYDVAKAVEYVKDKVKHEAAIIGIKEWLWPTAIYQGGEWHRLEDK